MDLPCVTPPAESFDAYGGPQSVDLTAWPFALKSDRELIRRQRRRRAIDGVLVADPVRCQAALPLVSVITPTFNRARYLEETIESVLGQDYPCVEYIVLDDGSTDATGKMLERYRNRLVALRHENHGQAWTVNRGFAQASGEFICLVNSDDPLPQGALRELAAALSADPDVALVYPDWDMVDEEGEFLHHISLPDYSYVDMVRWFLCVPGPGTMFRRKLVADAGGWDTSYHHCPDYEWFVRAGLHGAFLHLPQTLAQWRQHEESITTSERGLARAHEYCRLMEDFFARDDLPPDLRAVEGEALRNAYITAALMMTHDPSAPNHRFQISDNLGAILANPEYRRRPTSRTKDGVIYDLQVSLGEAGEAIAWLQGLVAERDAIIARQEEGIAWLRGLLAERETTIAVQEEGIAWLRGLLAERGVMLAADGRAH
ncbi:MAG TPA: glycosyltransferase family 2 protein [Thermomicrobiales bacterium]|nr:glycosyltransferase family 2 protein [Thermomicrobiales bacterium]